MIDIYKKGRKKEYKIINECRKEGLIAFRSAGSHSPIDVVVIDLKERIIRFIQSKSYNISQSEKQRLLNEMSQLQGGFHVRFEVL